MNFTDKRISLMKDNKSKTLFKKGDKRPQTLRQCGLCGRQLTQYSTYISKYEALHSYYLCHLPNHFDYALCASSDSCKRFYFRKDDN